MVSTTPADDSIGFNEKTVHYWSVTEKGRMAEDVLRQTDPYEASCWMLLLKEAQSRPIEESRLLFEKAMHRFPTCVTFFKSYLTKEMAEGDPLRVEQLLSNYLDEFKDVALYEMYIEYLRSKYKDSHDSFGLLKEAFQRAISYVGLDYNSYTLWNDYINHMRSSAEQGSYAEIQKVRELRFLFQDAIQIPMNNIDALWRDYSAFEQTVSRVNSEKVLGEKMKDYTNSRRVAKDCESMTKGLLQNTIPLPPQNTPSEQKQKSLWVQLINWEKNNPLGLEDAALLVKRVMYTSEHYLMNFCFHPMAWCETLHYLQHFCWKMIETGDKIVGQAFLKQTRNLYLKAVGDSRPMCFDFLVNFSYADFERSCNNMQVSTSIYEKLLTIPNVDHSLVYVNYMKHCKWAHGMQKCREIFNRARADPNVSHEVFVAAAQMEFFENRDSLVSLKIFEIGLKRFVSSRKFIEAFVFHLLQLSDETNIRLLFEKLLKACKECDKPFILLNYHKYEAVIGNTQSLSAIERRIIEHFNNKVVDESYLKRLMFNKYCYNEIHSSTFSDDTGTASIFENGLNKDSLITPSQNSFSNQRVSGTMLVPDVSQMRPFKPIPLDTKPPFVTPQVVPGGLFDPDALVLELLENLPPPSSVKDHVNIDLELLMSYCVNANIDMLSDGQMSLGENPQHTFTKKVHIIPRPSEISASSVTRDNLEPTPENAENPSFGSVVLSDLYQARLDKKLFT